MCLGDAQMGNYFNHYYRDQWSASSRTPCPGVFFRDSRTGTRIIFGQKRAVFEVKEKSGISRVLGFPDWISHSHTLLIWMS